MALVPAEQACLLLDRGRVLEDEPYAAWAEPARGAQVALVRRARLAYVDAALAAGEHRRAVGVATAGVADDPLDEQMARRLMAAHHGAGEPARALQAYARLREELAETSGPTLRPRPRPCTPLCCATSRSLGRSPRPDIPGAPDSTAPGCSSGTAS